MKQNSWGLTERRERSVNIFCRREMLLGRQGKRYITEEDKEDDNEDEDEDEGR